MFACLRKWHPLLRALCCLQSSETASGPSPPVFLSFLLCLVFKQRRCLHARPSNPSKGLTWFQSKVISGTIGTCRSVLPRPPPSSPSVSVPLTHTYSRWIAGSGTAVQTLQHSQAPLQPLKSLWNGAHNTKTGVERRRKEIGKEKERKTVSGDGGMHLLRFPIYTWTCCYCIYLQNFKMCPFCLSYTCGPGSAVGWGSADTHLCVISSCWEGVSECLFLW